MDKVETLREIYKRIEEAAIIDPKTARKIKDIVDNMEIKYERDRGGVSIEYGDAYNEEEGYFDPFEKLAAMLDDVRCRNLPEHLENELNAIIEDEFKKLLRDLENEFEHLISDETIIETLDANGYLFTEDGERIPCFHSDLEALQEK